MTAALARLVKRGKSYQLDGQPCPSVTTILREGFPAPALVTWAARETAGYAVDQWEELAQLTTSQRLRELEGAAWKRRDQKALRGTQIHELGEALSHGRPVEVPEHLVAPVESYARFLDTWHVRVTMTETAVCHLGHGWAGTIDLRGWVDSQDWLLDLKTGKGVYESHALQVAAYAHASHYLDEQGLLQEWKLPARAGVIHVSADRCELLPIDFSERTYRTFRHAQAVAAWAREASVAYRERRPWPVGSALNPPAA